jgi:hypothetical protein
MEDNIPRATTEAAVMALKALELPRRIRPKMITQAVVQRRALRGTTRASLYLAQIWLKGRPRSRLKA